MKINIVCYEELDSWICGKIARRLKESLCELGHHCSVGPGVVESADINHHIIYLNYAHAGSRNSLHTTMVTHIDNGMKLTRLKKGLETARAAICMSRETVEKLQLLGIAREQLQYAHMAHDGKAIEKKYVIGLTYRLYPDGRKRESDLVKLLDFISPHDFSFKIMGFGWQPIVEKMRGYGFGVDYHPDFDYDQYMSLMAGLDYYLYIGEDEGSVGFIDALAAGVKTIANPQGFHLDAKGGITHAVGNFDELKDVFGGIAAEKQARVNAVKGWTWENYARKHLEIWEDCLSGRSLHGREEGVRPIEEMSTANALRWRLWINTFVQRTRMILNLRNQYECQSRIWEWRRKLNKNKGTERGAEDNRLGR